MLLQRAQNQDEALPTQIFATAEVQCYFYAEPGANFGAYEEASTINVTPYSGWSAATRPHMESWQLVR